MTLYLESLGAFTPWTGERVNDVLYPRNIEQLWSAAELEAIGLWRDDMIAPADEVPDGKIVVSTTVQRVEDVVQFVHELADAPYPTADDVVAELTRRLAEGFDYDFSDDRGVHHVGTTEDDMRKWMDEVTPISQAMINAGQPDGEIGIATDTGPVTVTAMEWQRILVAAGQWRQPIYQASFALQAMDPIPRDFRDDSYWAA